MTDPTESPAGQEATEKTPLSQEEAFALECQKLHEEIELQKEKYLRSLAELENTRKRMQKERQEMTKFAVEGVIADFLAPLDSLEKALSYTDQMSADTKHWAMGFRMLLTQFYDVLTQHDITSFPSKGKMFDPRLHEAVSVEETENVPEGYILEEFAKGYQSADRTLRPARVKVAKGKAQKVSESSATSFEEIE